jgi:hypothetical protein
MKDLNTLRHSFVLRHWAFVIDSAFRELVQGDRVEEGRIPR